VPSDEAVTPRITGVADEKPLPTQAGGQAFEGAAVLQYDVPGALVVAARGAYDLHSIKPLAQALGAAVRTYPKVILDASGVTFADSTFLNLLILTHQSGAFRLVAPSQPVRRLCEITAVDQVLQIRDTVDAAASS
jgi:anti-anti-sigma factor